MANLDFQGLNNYIGLQKLDSKPWQIKKPPKNERNFALKEGTISIGNISEPTTGIFRGYVNHPPVKLTVLHLKNGWLEYFLSGFGLFSRQQKIVCVFRGGLLALKKLDEWQMMRQGFHQGLSLRLVLGVFVRWRWIWAIRLFGCFFSFYIWGGGECGWNWICIPFLV